MQNLEHWNLQATEIGSNHHSLQGLSVQGIVHVDFSFLNVFYAIKDGCEHIHKQCLAWRRELSSGELN